MKNTVIIIPTRLDAQRFPNNPLAHINNIPMIVHVLNRAKESQVGQVYVACLLYTSPSPRDGLLSRMPSSA